MYFNFQRSCIHFLKEKDKLTQQSYRTSNLRYTKIGTSMKGTSWNTGASRDTDGVHILFLKRQEAKTPHHAQPPKAFNQLFFPFKPFVETGGMLRYNCIVPFNILIQLCCRWLIFQSSSIWDVGPLYRSYIWVLVALWRRGKTGAEEKAKFCPFLAPQVLH